MCKAFRETRRGYHLHMPVIGLLQYIQMISTGYSWTFQIHTHTYMHTSIPRFYNACITDPNTSLNRKAG